MGRSIEERLRSLPAVEVLLQQPVVLEALSGMPRSVIVRAARETLQDLRDSILSDPAGPPPVDLGALAGRVVDRAKLIHAPRFRAVLNATGVVVHTNLGRSILCDAAVEAVRTAATRYNTLEYDLGKGTRTTRQQHVESLLCELTGAEAAMAVNNNAAAVMLLAHSLSCGRQIVISRGELVEIGGSFRLPDVLDASGAERVEVGTTNRTTLKDYEAAVGPRTAMLLKVHRSNFVLSGYVTEVGLADLVALGRRCGVPVVEDLGSGALVDLARAGVRHEPMPSESISAGVDAVTFSGDKLLGGAQAGLIVGRGEVIARLRGSPMARAVRIDKLNLAALEATLRVYRDPERALAEVPTLRLIARRAEDLETIAHRMAGRLSGLGGALGATVEPGVSEIGGGSSPDVGLATNLLCLSPRSMSAGALAEKLRRGNPPVVVRVREDRVLVDPRTLLPGEEDLVVTAIEGACLGREEGKP